MNFPGHRYLGPGNPTNNGPPVDKDDEIAQSHDLPYSKTTTSKDIRTADKKAIVEFSKNSITTGNWHSAVGVTGLSAKYAVESITGVLYPSTPRKRHTENQLLAFGAFDRDRPKRAKIDNQEQLSPISQDMEVEDVMLQRGERWTNKRNR